MASTRLPFSGAHWVDHVARHAYSIPEQIALRFQGESITWADLHQRVQLAAAGFAERGVQAGDRVAILMTNRPEFLEAALAANALGAIAVPVNFRLAPAEAAYVLADSGARLVVTDGPLAPLAVAASAALPQTPHIVVAGPPSGEPLPGGAEPYQAMLDHSTGVPPEVTVGERDVALIMYTSGTTGRPKGAMLTHLNLLMQAITAIRTGRLNGADHVGLLNVPFFHIAGIGGLPPALMLGLRTVIMPTAAFDAQTTLDVIETERVTSMFGVPAQWQMLCAHPGVTQQTRSLRSVSWGAAPATVTLLQTMNEKFPGAEIISVFGQTEMSPVTTSLPAADAIRKIGSVGKPVPTIAARIVDDQMNDVAPGQVGEIVYRGPTLMAGYWNMPEATEEAFAGGWFHSGDLVRQDDEGFIYVVDRKKDMIISGGENIYCAEVENVLAGHPAVADIAIVGARHERWGETPIAVIVPADPAAPPTLEDLAGWSRDKLSSYKKPTGLVLLDQLPRNAAGKVLKGELRARYGGSDAGVHDS